jgi:hypothetical protein
MHCGVSLQQCMHHRHQAHELKLPPVPERIIQLPVAWNTLACGMQQCVPAIMPSQQGSCCSAPCSPQHSSAAAAATAAVLTRQLSMRTLVRSPLSLLRMIFGYAFTRRTACRHSRHSGGRHSGIITGACNWQLGCLLFACVGLI